MVIPYEGGDQVINLESTIVAICVAFATSADHVLIIYAYETNKSNVPLEHLCDLDS